MPTTQIQLDKPMPLPAKREPDVQWPEIQNLNVHAASERIRTARGRYPFKLLEIGDSFAVPIDEVDRADAAARYYGKTSDTQLRRFTRRQDKVAGTVRFWRVS